MCHDTPLMVLDIIIIEHTEVLGERWLQPRITLPDIQRVTIVCDIQQVRHRGLTTIGTIGKAQLAHLGDLPTEIGCRREIRHRTDSIRMNPLVVLCEMGALWQYLETYVQVICLTDDTQHDLRRMVIVTILREATQVVIPETLQWKTA